MPGLAAKDVVDVQVTVAALEDPVAERLAGLGYRRPEGVWTDHRPPGALGPDEDWAKWYFFPPAGLRRTNTHVRVLGRPNQRYPLLFRDFLRQSPAMAEAYARLKRALAAGLRDPADYPDVKDPAVDLIYLAAEDWARVSGWEIGPADA